MLNDARRQARTDIQALGGCGDIMAIMAAITEANQTEPGWDSATRVDENNVVVALWATKIFLSHRPGPFQDFPALNHRIQHPCSGNSQMRQ